MLQLFLHLVTGRCHANATLRTAHHTSRSLMHYERFFVFLVFLHPGGLHLPWILSDALVVLVRNETICDPDH